MQVEVDVKYMQTNFGGPGLSSFGDFAPFQIWPTMHLPSENHSVATFVYYCHIFMPFFPFKGNVSQCAV